MKDYSKEAKEKYGDTEAYKEFIKKGMSKDDMQNKGEEMMKIFAEFGACMENPPESEKAQQIAKKLRDYICANFYNCTPEIFRGLAEIYPCEGEMKDNIDSYGGKGCAEFASKAIIFYCDNGCK